MGLATRTIEFRLPDNTIPAEHLEQLRLLWNDCLELLNWRQHYLRAVECDALDLPRVAIEKTKQGDEFRLHCWIGKDTRIDRSKSWDKGNIIFIPQVRLVPQSWTAAPPIESRSTQSVCKVFAKKIGQSVLDDRFPRYIPGALPSGLMQEQVKNACTAWERYIKSGNGKPLNKSARFPVTTIQYSGFRDFCSLTGDQLKLLGMPVLTVPGLERMHQLIEATYQTLLVEPSDRVLESAKKIGLEAAARRYAQPGMYRLIRRGTHDYLQLVGEFAYSVPIARAKAIKVTVGGDYLYRADNGVQIKNYESPYTDRIIRLQRVLTTKKYGSNNWKKLNQKINDLQGKQARAKRKYQQYHASWLTSANGIIHLEKVPPEIIPVPVPIPDGQGDYAPNGATVISEINLKAARAAASQFIEIIKQQGACKNRVVSGTINKSDSPDSTQRPKAEKPHGKTESNNGHLQGNSQEDSVISLPKKRATRNRRREKAIG